MGTTTMTNKPKSTLHKNWKCDECGQTYESCIGIVGVTCSKCSRKTGRQSKWMKPLEDHNE